MSISDELMARYYSLLLGEDVPAALHPMEAKKQLAWKLTARFHDAAAADAARTNWEAQFSKKDFAAAELPGFTPGTDRRALTLVAGAFAACFQIDKSKTQIRQLIQQGSVRVNEEKVGDPGAELSLQSGDVLRLDKTHVVRVG